MVATKGKAEVEIYGAEQTHEVEQPNKLMRNQAAHVPEVGPWGWAAVVAEEEGGGEG